MKILPPERVEKLRHVISKVTGPITVLITQVDPDALAGAFAMAGVVRSLRPSNGFDLKIVYCGAFGHPQNRAASNLFDLAGKMRNIRDVKPADLANVILVDSSTTTDGRLPKDVVINPFVVIDHHRAANIVENENTFVWVEDAGSVSTLIVQLLAAINVRPEDMMGFLPALLALGIHTDTGGLINCHNDDREAYSSVTANISGLELANLFSYPLPSSYFDNLHKALGRVAQKSGRLVTNIGTVKLEQGDDLSTISDMFIRRDDVSLVVVWGIIGRTVRISARNTDISRPLEAFLKDRFGESSGAKLSPQGTGIGGGMISLELGVWMTPDTVPEVEAMVSKHITSLVFRD